MWAGILLPGNGGAAGNETVSALFAVLACNFHAIKLEALVEQHNMPKIRRYRRRWSSDSLNNAMTEVKSGKKSIRQAAAKFDIPKSEHALKLSVDPRACNNDIE